MVIEQIIQWMFKNNSMVNYGIVILGCLLKRDEVEKKQMEDNDANKGIYEEYVIKQVSQSFIIRILIPKIFKEKIERNYPFIKKLDVEWCNLTGKVWDDSINGKRVASEEDLNICEICLLIHMNIAI